MKKTAGMISLGSVLSIAMLLNVSANGLKTDSFHLRKVLYLTLIGLTFSLGVVAQSKEQTEVADAVESLRKAMVSGDRTSLESIAAAELTYGHSGGKIENKEEFVEAFVSGKSNFESIEITEQSIKVFGNTAIVRHKLSGKTNDLGKEPGTVNLSILLVWIKNGSKWQLVARQAVKI